MKRENKKELKEENTPLQPETSPEVFDLLDAFTARLKPAASLVEATKRYTTKEIIAAIKEFNDDLRIRDSVVVEYLEKRGFHYEALPDLYSLKFHWLFAEK